MDNLINRDASDKYKGFRYQKLRLAKKMLELIKANPRTNIIAIPEFRDDGYLVGKSGQQIFEQNKEYSNNFTFNSEEVRKSMVNFIDNFFDLHNDPYLHFVFYTNVEYAKERQSGLLDKLELKPLDKPVIKFLIEHNFNDSVIDFVSKVLMQTYRDEYNIHHNKPETYKCFYEKVIEMSREDWVQFLKQVTFQFGKGDLDHLVLELNSEIKLCSYYSIDHVNKEEQIKSCILEKIDGRMAESHITQKMLNFETIRNVFYEIGSKDNNLMFDELHIYWSEVTEELDTEKKFRNLSDKVKAVCENFKGTTMKRYNREATTVRDEIKKYDKRQIYALRFRVYESMERYFDNDGFIFKNSYIYEELTLQVKKLKENVVNDIDVLKKDFDYGVKNNITIEKMVLLLIDECFYSFDGE